jgi:hypothetical protein
MSLQIGQFTIGCDPELFLQKNGQYVASQRYIHGTKKKPLQLKNGGFAMRDNVAAEFGVPPAVTCMGWEQIIRTTLADLDTLLPGNVKLTPVASAHFPKKQLRHRECKEFGCEPDFNAWTMSINAIDNVEAAKDTFRSCGGHIHIGAVDGGECTFLYDLDNKGQLIRTMDCIHGLLSTVLDRMPESIERRKLYGRAGCFRPTSYGVEYRTLSNFWIKSPRLVTLMFFLTRDALAIVKAGESNKLINTIGGDAVQRIINEGDVDEATDMIDQVVDDYLSHTSMQLYDNLRSVDLPNLDFYNEWEIAG